MKPPSPFAGPSSERRSPLNQNPSSAALRAARAVAQSTTRPSSIATFSIRKLIGIEPDARRRPIDAAVRADAERNFRVRRRAVRRRGTRRAPALRAPARRKARALCACGCAAAPISTRPSVSVGVGSRRTSIAPPMRTGMPASCVASLSKRRAVLRPVDEMRPDQRRHQRQDDRHTDSEQGRLQSVLRAPSVRIRPGDQPSTPNAQIHRTYAVQLMAANICRIRAKSIKMRRFFRDS